jgi:hypothetical protein
LPQVAFGGEHDRVAVERGMAVVAEAAGCRQRGAGDEQQDRGEQKSAAHGDS